MPMAKSKNLTQHMTHGKKKQEKPKRRDEKKEKTKGGSSMHSIARHSWLPAAGRRLHAALPLIAIHRPDGRCNKTFTTTTATQVYKWTSEEGLHWNNHCLLCQRMQASIIKTCNGSQLVLWLLVLVILRKGQVRDLGLRSDAAARSRRGNVCVCLPVMENKW